MSCGPASPTPSPSPSGLLGGVDSGLGGDSAPGGIPAVPLVTTPDPGAPIMTLPAAQLGGSSLSFTGLQALSLVTVPLANGQQTTVIRLAADTITITDFTLDVRPSGDVSGLVSTATTMELSETSSPTSTPCPPPCSAESASPLARTPRCRPTRRCPRSCSPSTSAWSGSPQRASRSGVTPVLRVRGEPGNALRRRRRPAGRTPRRSPCRGCRAGSSGCRRARAGR